MGGGGDTFSIIARSFFRSQKSKGKSQKKVSQALGAMGYGWAVRMIGDICMAQATLHGERVITINISARIMASYTGYRLLSLLPLALIILGILFVSYYPDFNWDNLELLLSGQTASVVIAVTAYIL